MTQTWDATDYGKNAAFVHGMAGGVVEWLDAKPGESILDLGCGDGQLTLRIASTGARVVPALMPRRRCLPRRALGGLMPMKATPSRCPLRIIPSTLSSRMPSCIGYATRTR